MVSGLGRSVRLAAALATTLGLAACGEEPVSEISFDELKRLAEGGDAAAFKARFDAVKGKKIAWSGQVVEVRREFGDDYVQEGVMTVDVAPTAAPPVADATFKFSPSRLADFTPGQPVTFSAVIREYEIENGALLLRLELDELQ